MAVVVKNTVCTWLSGLERIIGNVCYFFNDVLLLKVASKRVGCVVIARASLLPHLCMPLFAGFAFPVGNARVVNFLG